MDSRLTINLEVFSISNGILESNTSSSVVHLVHFLQPRGTDFYCNLTSTGIGTLLSHQHQALAFEQPDLSSRQNFTSHLQRDMT